MKTLPERLQEMLERGDELSSRGKTADARELALVLKATIELTNELIANFTELREDRTGPLTNAELTNIIQSQIEE